MKKKFLSFVMAMFCILPCALVLSACDENPPKDPDTSAIVYTVTEGEWETNFDITQDPAKGQILASKKDFVATSSLEEITSYTLFGEGEYYGEAAGTGLLKVDPNALYIEFYVGGKLTGDHNGITPCSEPFYVGITAMLRSFFPFSGKYNDFTFDEAKKAYIGHNFVSTVVDEDDIEDTYDMYIKNAEVTFINGYLNTVTIDLCDDDQYGDPFAHYVFTFSNINKTVVA